MNILYDNHTNEEIGQDIYCLIEKAINETLKHENFNQNVEISILFVDNGEIKVLNREYRGIDKATDVLSFALLEGEDADFSKNPETNDIMLGDIVISLQKAKEQAEEYGHAFSREIGFLVVHSLLHLLGYDHKDVEEEKQMIEKQEKILNKIGLIR